MVARSTLWVNVILTSWYLGVSGRRSEKYDRSECRVAPENSRYPDTGGQHVTIVEVRSFTIRFSGME
jgi:hypothetical protein